MSTKFVITGKRPLYGEIPVSGMKNAALPILFATILTGDVCTLENIPAVSDGSSNCSMCLLVLDMISLFNLNHSSGYVAFSPCFSNSICISMMSNDVEHLFMCLF